MIAVGGSTWSQGPSRYVRQFFELAGGQYLGGVSATAWATAGGAHTGGAACAAPPAEGLDMSFIEAMCAVLACVSPSRINPTQRREHADLWVAPT